MLVSRLRFGLGRPSWAGLVGPGLVGQGGARGRLHEGRTEHRLFSPFFLQLTEPSLLQLLIRVKRPVTWG